MKNLLILLTILVFEANGFAQDVWHFDDDHFNISVYTNSVKYDSTAHAYGRAVTKVEIEKNNEIFQTITPEIFVHEAYHDSSFIFKYEDVNFDGHNDIALVNWISTNHQTTAWYWIFNPKNQKFIQNTSFKDLMNVQVDANKKCIYTNWRIGMNEFGHAIYQWKNNELILKIEQTEYWGIDPILPGTRLIKENTNGKITEREYPVKEHTPLLKKELYELLWK